MKRLILLVAVILSYSLSVFPENWDNIVNSGDYYYGVGTGKNPQEAQNMAISMLSNSIVSHISNSLDQQYFQKDASGGFDYTETMLSCVKSYSQASINNLKFWPVEKSKDNEIRAYVKKSEVLKMFDLRVDRAKDMVLMADEELELGKIDMALEYYYWAYSLVRSIQSPNTVKDADGRLMLDRLSNKIKTILSDVKVKYIDRIGDQVDLLFTYKDNPVSSIQFTYNDGRQECEGHAKDGRGMIEMIPGYETEIYHINIEYEFKGQASGDSEMESILKTIVKQPFSQSEFKVASNTVKQGDNTIQASVATEIEVESTGIALNPNATQLIDSVDIYVEKIDKLIKAIENRSYVSVMPMFTSDGRKRFSSLIQYGKGRILGEPKIHYFKSANGSVTARGLQMAFTFNTAKKQTYVEDVVFTFDKDKRIDNVTFGLGSTANKDILTKDAPGWKDATREMLMEFLENYKTAYCLKDSDYIKNVFSDDAVIIVGKVAKRKQDLTYLEGNVSQTGMNVITYNRYDKATYLRNLCKTFNRNEFINLRFTNNDIQWLEKYKDKDIFAIQIGQEYYSSVYADKGFLFLLVDMTDHNNPMIYVRTWQPNEVDMKDVYHAGDFVLE